MGMYSVGDVRMGAGYGRWVRIRAAGDTKRGGWLGEKSVGVRFDTETTGARLWWCVVVVAVCACGDVMVDVGGWVMWKDGVEGLGRGGQGCSP